MQTRAGNWATDPPISNLLSYSRSGIIPHFLLSAALSTHWLFFRNRYDTAVCYTIKKLIETCQLLGGKVDFKKSFHKKSWYTCESIFYPPLNSWRLPSLVVGRAPNNVNQSYFKANNTIILQVAVRQIILETKLVNINFFHSFLLRPRSHFEVP